MGLQKRITIARRNERRRTWQENSIAPRLSALRAELDGLGMPLNPLQGRDAADLAGYESATARARRELQPPPPPKPDVDPLRMARQLGHQPRPRKRN